jgi:glycerol-1-phosphatase
VTSHDVVFFDLDGVVYAGRQAIAYAPECIGELQSAGVHCCFITNNASRGPNEVAQHLQAIGIDAHAEDVVTSGQAGVRALQEQLTAGAPVLVLGGPGLHRLVADAGFAIVSSANDQPAAVIQGFGPDLSWRDLAEASYAIAGGARWIATNPDTTFPTDRGLAPGNGSLVAAVAAAVGRAPDLIAGKPEPALLQEGLRRTGAKSPLLVGDRLDTDISAGARVGIPTVLVLTGVNSRADIEGFPDQPDHVIDDLRGLIPLVLGRLPAGGHHAR